VNDTRVVLTTTDSAEEAERLARAAVDARLAACVQIVGPVRSVFRWEGASAATGEDQGASAATGEDQGASEATGEDRAAVSVETEWQLLAKTAAARVADLIALLVGAHSYDVPEVIVLPVVGGHGPYLSWVTQETAGPTDG
jgi:periplasmic divalent cation tolerance protein